ncbi:hypothetical protein PR048_018509 [Dryococelus australis]|uniref:DDE-1 domain-containing protein n=1 Tax=Dryococelus australis TaxID=614101 RepID=A0ABQ9HCV4_9NEOP|nr:hypothetical protein PR048_018509 [Dryococelus australis]
MDAHSSHITPEVIELAREQQIFLLTFLFHTSYLLQPLDVGVYRALKYNCSKQLNSYMKKHPDKKPNRENFYEFSNPVFTETFIAQTIQNSFKRSGIMPLNKSSISIESQAPSKLSEKQSMGEILPGGSPRDSEELLQLPHTTRNQTQNVNKKRDGSAKCPNPPSGLGKNSRNNLGRETNTPTEQDKHSKFKQIESIPKPSTSDDRSPLKFDNSDETCGSRQGKFFQMSRSKLELHGYSALFVLLPTMNNVKQSLLLT